MSAKIGSVIACAALVVAVAGVPHPRAQTRAINDFFNEFTAEWVRGNPTTTSTCYFTGQTRNVSNALTPETDVTPPRASTCAP
jgi:hypothetical protein